MLFWEYPVQNLPGVTFYTKMHTLHLFVNGFWITFQPFKDLLFLF